MKTIIFISIFLFSSSIWAKSVELVEEQISPLNIPLNQLVSMNPVKDVSIQQATMHVQNTNDPYVAQSIELVETRTEEETNYSFLINDQELKFETTKVIASGCGSKLILAKSFQGQEMIEMQLNDHRGRKCKDFKKFKWEVKVKTRIQDTNNEYQMLGNPRKI